MDIVIDSGNSVTKIGVFRDSEVSQVQEFSNVNKAINFVNELKPQNVILSSVKFKPGEFIRSLKIPGIFLVLNHNTPVPIKNSYDTPKTLGMDRLAAAVGAWSLFPNKNILIIDIGTCTTYDLIQDNGEFIGGSISPGIDIRFQSLHEYTANLPLVRNDWNYITPGQTTEDAIKSGVINGMIAECEGFIYQYQRIYSNLTIILTGGLYKLFESKIKGNIFAVPNLVITGLHRILLYNV
ncbi:type III pantothenate kinase [Bacteroidota bacterium]